ncbi:hypothetical protein [Microlunatus soli]|uniref:DUF2269 domain-containing protein n=1 Tax=Microlunatus soli TaxID=630515 RepID=A0A1H1Y827_9ACTN|nr:hypothetical protein [Microlunatus soli]SDT17554.1 hypothetical protein SAMN04489812_4443 [Microlunatus soli]
MTTISGTPRSTVRLRLPRGLRRGIVLAHIVTSISWLGIDIVMAVLIFTALFTDDPYLRLISYGALGRAIFWPLICTAVLSLISGLLLGWSSKYGVVRYTWVLIKLILNVVLGTLLIISLNPGLIELAEAGRQIFAGRPTGDLDLQTLIFPPIVSTSCLLFAGFLAVFKPWGRVGVSRRRAS